MKTKRKEGDWRKTWHSDMDFKQFLVKGVPSIIQQFLVKGVPSIISVFCSSKDKIIYQPLKQQMYFSQSGYSVIYRKILLNVYMVKNILYIFCC